MVGFRRVAQNDDNELAGRNDKDALTIVAVTPVHIHWDIRIFSTSVQPKEGAIPVLAIGSWRTGVVHPTFRKDSLVVNTSIIKVHLTKTGEILRGDIQIRRAHRCATHVLLKDSVADTQGREKSFTHITKESLIGREKASEIADDNICTSAGVVPMGARLVFEHSRLPMTISLL